MTQTLLTISPDAQAHIEQIRTQRSEGPGHGFRLGLKKSGCSGWLYQPTIVDVPCEDDVRLIIEGLTVFLPKAHETLLRGTHIKLVNKGLGQQVLEYQNPNAEAECGCGESFSVKGEEA